MKLKLALLIFFILGCYILSHGQDAQFTQFFSSTVNLNPAFAGATKDFRFQSIYRNQWPSIPANYVSTAFSMDKNMRQINSGVAVTLATDKAGSANLANNAIGVAYAYKLNITQKVGMRAGMQFSMHSLNFDFSKLTFGDQLDSRGKIYDVTADDQINNGINYLSVASGFVLFTKKFWIGGVGRHLNEPDQSLYGETPSTLPMYFSFHGGFEQPLTQRSWRNTQQVKLVSVFQYKSQGRFDQLDIGSYLQYQNTAFGLLYRGLALKRYDRTEPNHDAISVFTGYRWEQLRFGYSYDLTVSKLRAGTGGAHEISLTFEFSYPPDRNKPKTKDKLLECPDFLK